MQEKCSLLFVTLSLFIIYYNISYAASVPFFRKDYIYDSETENFYKIHTIKRNWTDAQKRCRLELAELFVPESQLDRDVARELVDGKFPKHPELPIYPWLYIGIHDMFSEGEFVTFDGRSIDSVFIEWDVSEPNNIDNEDCVAMRRNGRMNDLKCNLEIPFICKKPLADVNWNILCGHADFRYLYDNTQEKCYKLHTTPTSWAEAYAICAAELSYLAIINSESEADHLVRLVASGPKVQNVPHGFNSYEVHLGFYKLSEGQWITINGQALEDVGYSRWFKGQPDNWFGYEGCGSMLLGGFLNDEHCTNSTAIFICEHDIDPLPPSIRSGFVNITRV